MSSEFVTHEFQFTQLGLELRSTHRKFFFSERNMSDNLYGWFFKIIQRNGTFSSGLYNCGVIESEINSRARFSQVISYFLALFRHLWNQYPFHNDESTTCCFHEYGWFLLMPAHVGMIEIDNLSRDRMSNTHVPRILIDLIHSMFISVW